MIFAYGVVLGLILAGALCLAWQVRRRNIGRWVISYAFQIHRRRALQAHKPVHVLLCIADHFEPHHGAVSREIAWNRIQNWLSQYPRLFSSLQDSDGRPPRHTFFFPLEQYDPEHLDALGKLCRRGFGEVEVHLHHDGDTSEELRERLIAFRNLLASRHGQLARHKETGRVAYAFIHGDWALDNSRPDRRC